MTDIQQNEIIEEVQEENKQDPKEIAAENLKELRRVWKESGYTTLELSEITGYPFQSIKSWVQGRRNIPREKVEDIKNKIDEYEKSKVLDNRIIKSE